MAQGLFAGEVPALVLWFALDAVCGTCAPTVYVTDPVTPLMLGLLLPDEDWLALRCGDMGAFAPAMLAAPGLK